MRPYILLLLLPALLSAQDSPAKLSRAEAFRFLNFATFGPTRAEVDHVREIGREQWLEEQFTRETTQLPGYLNEKPVEWAQDYFYQNVINEPDQLRQRTAFALSKIFVVSAVEVNSGEAMVNYQNWLAADAFDNVSTILKHIALHPAMGEYLDMVNNAKQMPGSNKRPNENWARELLQLFSIGLTQLNPDGTPKLDARGQPLSAYTEEDVKEYTRAFTGWTYAPLPGRTSRAQNPAYYADFMIPVEANHDTERKTLLGGVELPAGQSAQKDLDDAVTSLYAHPNIAPFLGRQLIQQLVGSNPTPAYIERVSKAFEDNGQGVRGDMKAILRAILLDPEAVNPPMVSAGHLKEPVLFAASLLRQIGGTVADHPFLSDQASEMGQKLLFAPSVFSYFSPNYRIPGHPALMGPEFQILTSETALRRVNFVWNLVAGGYGADVKLDFARFNAAANDTEALVTLVDEDILGGRMSATMRALIVTAVNAQQGAVNRVRTALYLAGSSAEFQVVR